MKKFFILYYIISLIVIFSSFTMNYSHSSIDKISSRIWAELTPTPSESPTPTETTSTPTSTPTPTATPTPSMNILLTSPSIDFGSFQSPSTKSASGGNITIQSDVPWNLTVSGTDFIDNTTGFKIPISRLSVIINHNEVDYQAILLTKDEPVFLLQQQYPIDTTSIGGESLMYDLAIRSTDRAGSYSAVITYTISAASY